MDRQLGEWNKRREAKEKEDRSQQRQKEAASLAISPTGGRRKIVICRGPMGHCKREVAGGAIAPPAQSCY